MTARPTRTSSPAPLSPHALDYTRFVWRVIRNMPGMVYRCANDRDWTMEYVSPGCHGMTGFAPEDLIGNRVVSYASLIHPDDAAHVRTVVEEALRRRQAFQVTYRLRRVDGSERFVWEQGQGVIGATGKVEAIEGFICDLTHDENLMRRAIEREGQASALIRQSLVGVYVIQDGAFVYVNPRLAQLFGATEEELLALPAVTELVHPDDRELVAGNLRARLEGRTSELNYEFRGVRREGSVIDVQVHGQRIEWEGAPAVMGALIDVTASKREQREFNERLRREALAQLATGVAHDFNNVLGVIRNMASLVRQDLDGQAAADLDEIISATQRAAALTRQLTTFGRGLSEDLEVVSVNQIIEDLVPILGRLGSKGTQLDVELAPDLSAVHMHPADVEAVVMNLVANAFDAMPKGGTVRIVTTEERLPHSDEVLVAISIQDEGVGIEPRVLEQVFEPYFTTKGDRGTGLGLGNVRRIVEEAGGEVDVHSVVGEGSTFMVRLPAASPEV